MYSRSPPQSGHCTVRAAESRISDRHKVEEEAAAQEPVLVKPGGGAVGHGALAEEEAAASGTPRASCNLLRRVRRALATVRRWSMTTRSHCPGTVPRGAAEGPARAPIRAHTSANKRRPACAGETVPMSRACRIRKRVLTGPYKENEVYEPKWIRTI